MATASPVSTRRRNRVRILAGARAVAAAALAAAITFNADHTPMYGLLAYGVFQLIQGAIVALGVQQQALSTTGRVLIWARAIGSVVTGVVALALPHGGLGTLLAVSVSGSLVVGVLELVSGLRRADRRAMSGEAAVIGGMTILMGLVFIVANDDAVFVVGVIGAWGAIVAVYLGIAAASMGHEERAA